ncbi:Uncharacterised protein r2_g4122 [Pycnogonum litorale]
MKSLARQYFWWPNISDDVETFVKSCALCQTCAAAPPRQHVQPWPAADVWERVHLDFFAFKGKDYRVLFDAGSKYEVAGRQTNVFNYVQVHTSSLIQLVCCLRISSQHPHGWRASIHQ